MTLLDQHSARSALLKTLTRLAADAPATVEEAQGHIVAYLADKGARAEKKWQDVLWEARSHSPQLAAFAAQARVYSPLAAPGVWARPAHAPAAACPRPAGPAWHILPTNVLGRVGQHLGAGGLAQLEATSQAWRAKLQDDAIWQPLYPTDVLHRTDLAGQWRALTLDRARLAASLSGARRPWGPQQQLVAWQQMSRQERRSSAGLALLVDGLAGDGRLPEALSLRPEALSLRPEVAKRMAHWVEQGLDEAVYRALDAGVNANVRHADNGCTALMLAAQRGDVGLVRALLNAGAAPRARQPQSGRQPLDWALGAPVPHMEVALALIESGAHVDHYDLTFGRTALMFAAHAGDAASVISLLALGADPAAVNPDNGRQPLDWAFQDGLHLGTALALIAGGASVNHRDLRRGSTPLMFAAKAGNVTAVNTLLSLGADPSLRHARSGRRAVHWAQAGRTRGHREIEQILTRVTARPNERKHHALEAAQREDWRGALMGHAELMALSECDMAALPARDRALLAWQPDVESIVALSSVRHRFTARRRDDVDNFLRAMLCLLGPEVAWRDKVTGRRHSVSKRPAASLMESVAPRLPQKLVQLVLREDAGQGAVTLMFHAETHRSNSAATLRMAVGQVSACLTTAWKKDHAEGKQDALPRCTLLMKGLRLEHACLDARVRAVADVFARLDIAEDVPTEVADVRGVNPVLDAAEHLRVFLGEQLAAFAQAHGELPQETIEADPRFVAQYFNEPLFADYLHAQMPQGTLELTHDLARQAAEMTALFG